MASEGATSGVDLHLDLGLHDDVGSRRGAIEESLRAAIRGGRLTPGTRLPASRSLARDLGVARGTVTDAYDQLVAEGWLVARQGSGTTVADLTLTPARGEAPPGIELGPPTLPEPSPFNRDRTRGGRPGDPPVAHDFRPGTPDLSSFPRHEWLAALRRALHDAPDSALGYGDARGRPELREALATYLARARGVHTRPDLILVCGGWVQAIALVTTALADLGVTTFAMEEPSMPGYRAAARNAGLDVHPLVVDRDGADPAGLEGMDDVGAALLTPAHQYPTGATLSSARRPLFATWARRNDAVLIEDDYDGEFRYDRQPVGALQGLDPERVIYAGTAAKSLAPGLRLGWLALPPRLVGPVMAAKELADRHTGTLDQLALAELITSGAFDRHVRRSRTAYRRRRDVLLARLRDEVPAVNVTGIAAGLHAVVHLPAPGPSEDEVVAHLAAAGIATHGLAAYYWNQPAGAPPLPDDARPGIVIGFGTPPEHGFPAAVRALTATLAELYG